MPLTAQNLNLRRAFAVLSVLISLAFTASAQTSTACADTSYRMSLSAPGKELTFYTHCNTHDGGTVLIGRVADTANTVLSNVVMIKLNATGQITWERAFENLKGYQSYFSRIIELSNGSIVVFGFTASFSTTNTREMILCQFTGAGSVEWCKKFSLSSHFDSQDLLYPFFISEVKNQDLLLTISGFHTENYQDSAYAIMSRIDKTGNVVWSKAYTNDKFTWFMYPSGIYESTGDIISLGHVEDLAATCSQLSIYALRLDYLSGQPIYLKTYCYAATATSNRWQLTDKLEKDRFNSVKLINNQFVLFGRIAEIDTKEYAYKLLIDENLNMVSAKQYEVPNGLMAYSRLSVLADGSSHLFGFSGVGKSLYWAAFDSSESIIRQRKIMFDQATESLYGVVNFSYRNERIFNFNTNYRAAGKRYSLFTQLQKNDPSIDSCLGTDTSFASIKNIPFSTSNWTWKTVVDHPIVLSDFSLPNTSIDVVAQQTCSQISICDSLHIAGPDKVCDGSNFVQFTGQKNPGCYKRVLWEIDREAVDSMYQPNDSCLLVRFKPNQSAVPQSVTLYASAADCTVAKDTLVIALMPPFHQLPNDTTYCQPFTSTLSVGAVGKSYLWQDGSTDSVLQVSQPGTYSVRAESFCSDVFFDTTIIKIGPSVQLDLGADTSICEGQAMLLRAPASLQSFRWNDGSSKDSMLLNKQGLYWLSGLDSVGCEVSDSIRIMDLYSKPHLQILPASQVLCIGQNDTLRVSESFEKFNWNEGSHNNYLPVVVSGKYWLDVSDTNGCMASDTVTVQRLSPAPQHFLPVDTFLCAGKSIQLAALQPFEKYRWSNGATSPTISISNAGLIELRVTDKDGCQGVDSLKVVEANCQNKIFFPSAFTPNSDGLNDVFKASVQGELQSFSLQVYNRWGQVVFAESNYRKGWDGLLQSKPQPNGSYVWICHYKFADEEAKTEQGIFMLIR